jgi:hypothetical protein
MKKMSVLKPVLTALAGLGVMLVMDTASAATIYNNYAGGASYYAPFGNPNTATYGETFDAPSSPDTSLQEFGFHMGVSAAPGDIILQAYIATWTGSEAGTLLYSSPIVDFANTGPALLDFHPNGISLTPGGSYVAFLSISQNYGASAGESYVEVGNTSIPGSSFVYYNNSGNFSSLFSTTWDETGQTPNWGFQATFTPGSVPDGGLTIAMLGAAMTGLSFIRRKL